MRHHALLTSGLTLCLSSAAFAAGGDEASEVIDVTVPAGTADAPNLNLKLPRYELTVRDLQFPSGFRVLFQQDRSQPIVAITAVTDHGASDDPEGKEGIAHLVEHLWFRSEHGELPKVWDLLEAEMGCGLNAFTQYDITAYMTVCGSQNLEAMMKLESLRITDTVRGVTEPMVTTETEVVRNEIRMRTENFNIPFFTIWEFVNKHMFPKGHPYSRAMAGDHTSIRNCKLKDIQDFTESYYTPDNTTMMVVGDLPDTSFNYLVDLMVKTMDLSLMHPQLTDEHIKLVPKPGIAEPDPENPAHWFLVPMDPANPDKPLNIKVTRTPRRDAFAGLVPPDPVTPKLGTYEGPVEDPTVAVAWTLPAGYQGSDTLMNITGNLLTATVAQGLDYYEDELGNVKIADPDIADFGGCGALPSKQSTTMVCVSTLKDEDSNAERVADKMIDQVASLIQQSQDAQSNDIARQIVEQQFAYARNQYLMQLLQSVDLFAAVGAGRATNTAIFAHFTGSPAYFKTTMGEVTTIQSYQIAEIADTWLQRKRAAQVFIKPMTRDDVAMLSEDTEGSGGHYRGGGEDSILHPSIDPDLITPQFVRRLIALPDTSRLGDFTMPNGLRVVIMPHGESPLINAQLIAFGGTAVDPMGLEGFTRTFTSFDAGNPNLNPLRIAGSWYGSLSDEAGVKGITSVNTNLDAALWMLRERIESEKPDLSGRAQWIKRKERSIRSSWKSDSWHKGRLRKEHLNPGHPLNDEIDLADLEILKKYKGKDLANAIHAKWQPANSVLLIVGNVDVGTARQMAIKYWGGWRAADGVEVRKLDPIPGPNATEGRKIYVIDDEGKTQTQVELACPLKPAAARPSPEHQVLGDIARMTLFAKLREEAGVVYSPFAGAFVSPGGTATMFMTAAIQNDSAVFAMERYLDFLAQAEGGKISSTDLRIKKLSQASGFVLGQQSIDQMTGRLEGVLAKQQPWKAFRDYARDLANTSLDDLADITKGCADKAFITFDGPKDKITAQLDEAGYAYEVLDTDALYEEFYEANDPKGYAKYLKQKAKDEAKKAAEEAKEAAKGGGDAEGDEAEGDEATEGESEGDATESADEAKDEADED